MTIQQQPPVFASSARAATVPARNEEAPTTGDAVIVEDRKEIDEQNFSWLDLGKGVVGGAIGGAVQGVGIGASSLVRAPQMTKEVLKGVWQSKMLGPVLKTTLTPVVLAAGVISPVFAVLGGALYGMFEGFKEGAEKNPMAVFPASAETVKTFHKDIAGKGVEYVQELATKEPSTPDEVYEIKVIEAGRGLVGSAGAALVAGAGIGASTAVNLPMGYLRASSEIWKSDVALPLKVGGQILATGAAVLAVPLGAVGGALYGLGTGAYNGYQDGVLPAVGKAAKDVAEFQKAVHKAVYAD